MDEINESHPVSRNGVDISAFMLDEKSRHYSRYCHRDIGSWRWRRGSSRQYGISANVDWRKWRKYKAPNGFWRNSGIDSLMRLRALIDRKCCINTCVAATNPPNGTARNNVGLCWNSIHFTESHIIQFNARSPISLFPLSDQRVSCRIDIAAEYIKRYTTFCAERSHFDDRFLIN